MAVAKRKRLFVKHTMARPHQLDVILVLCTLGSRLSLTVECSARHRIGDSAWCSSLHGARATVWLQNRSYARMLPLLALGRHASTSSFTTRFTSTYTLFSTPSQFQKQVVPKRKKTIRKIPPVRRVLRLSKCELYPRDRLVNYYRNSHLGSMLMPASLAPRSVSSSCSSKAPRLCSSCTAFRRDSSGGASIACAVTVMYGQGRNPR